jgi:cytochrome c-type biogenesis protein CcmE
MNEVGQRKNRKALIGALIILSSIGWLAYSGIQNNGVYYVTVSEYAASGGQSSRNVRVTGLVVPGTIVTEADQKTVRFTVQDQTKANATMPVVYTGLIPDTFKAGRQVVVEGRRNAQGTFEADVLLAKCPSKYEAKDPAEGSASTQ